jgi:acetyl-CoA acetyltransferase
VRELEDYAGRPAATGGRGPDPVNAPMIRHFTPFVLMQLEEFGFCGRGEAAGFAADGGLELDGGRLPVNTHGGQLGEAYLHGMNGIAEAVRQLRGSAVNQVADARNVLVTAGTGVPTSGLLLGREQARAPPSEIRLSSSRARREDRPP